MTRQRVGILEALGEIGGHGTADEIDGHGTADEIGQILARRGRAVPRASLYHMPGTLASFGVLLVADAGPGTTRYELANDWHHHFVRRACGSITDVSCTVGAAPYMEPALAGVRVDEAQVIFRGLCSACVARGIDGRPSRSEAADQARGSAARQPRRCRVT